ncbi:MAG: hypothetical protein Kow00103_05430 [Candidatus Caldatribacteriota bacterium]
MTAMNSKNRLWLILIVVILILGAFFIIYNQNQSSLPPTISLSEEKWDFGKIKEDEKPEHIFKIKNNGGQELVINRVRAACGCTATMLSEENIQPGKEAELKVTFNATGYKGLVTKSIYIESNDPERPKVTLSVSVDVEPIPAPQANFSTSQWEMGLISQGDKPTFTFLIENKGELDLIIEKIDVAEYITYNYDLPLTIAPGGKEEIIFTYDSTGHELGAIRESIRVYCNDPRRKAFSVRIDGYIQEKSAPSLNISPVGISFNSGESSSEEAIKKVSLTNQGNQVVNITAVNTSVDYFIPLKSELTIAPGEKVEIPIIIIKDKLSSSPSEEGEKEFLYLTVALPISLNNFDENK